MNARNSYIFLFIIGLFFNTTIWSQTTSVMTYNIKYDNKNDTLNHWDKRKHTLVKLINHYGPSFLGTQEGLQHQIEYMDMALIDYDFVGVARKDGKKKGEYSALFYNKHQFSSINSGTFWLSTSPDEPSVGWDAALERICSYGLFEEKRTYKKIWVFNTHFDHVGKNARENSVALILKKIKQLNTQNYPVLLIGDFNLQPNETPIIHLMTQMDDGLKNSKSPFYGPSGTYNGFQNKPITRRIDYVFSKGVSVISYEHIDDRLASNRHISDHLPVFMTFKNLE